MNLSQEKAPREFSSLNEVTEYFKEHPAKLVEYVQKAMKVNASVLGVYLTQLSVLVDVPLEIKKERALVPPGLFISPTRFSNIDAILSLARVEFLNK